MKALLLIILFVSCQSRDKECLNANVKAFTHHLEDKLPIYKNTKGALLKEIDPDEEAGWIVQVIGVEGEYFKINIADLNLNEVWVLKQSLSLNTRNYDGQDIPLYKSPNKHSAEVATLIKEQTVIILDACRDWVYVKGKGRNGKEVKGWLEPDMQCGNPYTTCP